MTSSNKINHWYVQICVCGCVCIQQTEIGEKFTYEHLHASPSVEDLVYLKSSYRVNNYFKKISFLKSLSCAKFKKEVIVICWPGMH